MIFEYDENNLDKFENFKGGEKYIEAKMYFEPSEFYKKNLLEIQRLENAITAL